jgi:integrase/recombinase XerD
LDKKISQYNGIISDNPNKMNSSIIDCPRCELVNAIENKYCSKCSYPLKPEAYEEIKSSEEKRIETLQEKYENDMKMLREDMNNQFSQIMLMIPQNPKLSLVNPEILEKINEI